MPRAQAKEITIHLGKYLQKVQAKKRAPRAIKEIKKIVSREMATKDVRVDVKLNKHLWSKGVKSVPKRVRVKLQRKRSEDEDAGESFYTLVTYVPVTSFAGLLPVRSDE